MLGLFARFSDLYGALAQSKGLEIFREKNPNEFTREFNLWCLKLNDIDMEGIARGVGNLEKQIEENAANGKQSWPPNYCEFRGLCRLGVKRAIHKTHVALPPPILSDEDKAMRMKDIRKRFGL